MISGFDRWGKPAGVATPQTSWQEVFKKWGIPDYTSDPMMSGALDTLRDTAKHGYGQGYVYNQILDQGRTVAGAAFDKMRQTSGALGSKLGNTFSLGVANRLPSDALGALGGQLGKIGFEAESQDEQAKEQARGQILSFLSQQQGLIGQVMSGYHSTKTQKDIATKQLEAQESGCALVAERYGMTSLEERLMKIWEKMHIRMNRGKKIRRQVWRALFVGYHKAAPWVVSHTKCSRYISRMKRFVVDRFVAYILCDVMQHRGPTLGERLSAYVILVLSLVGWGFSHGKR